MRHLSAQRRLTDRYVLGALLGPMEATAVGTVFGLTSMWKASASYVMPSDQMFSPLFSGDPLGSLVLSVGSRALFGLLSGLLYAGARRLRPLALGVGAVSFFARQIHSLLVYSAMALFFPEAGYGPGIVFAQVFSKSDVLANCGTAAVVLLIWGASQTQPWIRFRQKLERSLSMHTGERYRRLTIAVMAAVTFGATGPMEALSKKMPL